MAFGVIGLVLALEPLHWGGWLRPVRCAQLPAAVHQGGVWVRLPCFLGSSWYWGVKRPSSVRFCLWPPAVGFHSADVCGQPVGVAHLLETKKECAHNQLPLQGSSNRTSVMLLVSPQYICGWQLGDVYTYAM